MRIAILSDIHANLEALRAVLGDIATRRADRILCLGDIVGYNADPAECIALVRAEGAVCIAGNHDRAVAGLIPTEDFGDTAARAVAWTRARLSPDALAFLAGLPLEVNLGGHVVGVHGTLGPEGGCDRTYLDSDARRLRCLEALAAHPSCARICAFGHTHRLEVLEFGDGTIKDLPGDEIVLPENTLHLVNPGTVGQPRGGEDRATYMTLDTTHRLLTVHRIAYDMEATRAKMLRAGLAPRPHLVPAPLRSALRWGARALGVAGRARQPASKAAAAQPPTHIKHSMEPPA